MLHLSLFRVIHVLFARVLSYSPSHHRHLTHQQLCKGSPAGHLIKPQDNAGARLLTQRQLPRQHNPCAVTGAAIRTMRCMLEPQAVSKEHATAGCANRHAHTPHLCQHTFSTTHTTTHTRIRNTSTHAVQIQQTTARCPQKAAHT